MKELKLHALKDGASRQGSYVHIVPLDPGLKTGDCGARSVQGVEGSAIQVRCSESENPENGQGVSEKL